MLARNRFDWLKDARFAWDAVANTWNQWVLGYNPDRQMRFLAQFGLSEITWQNMVIILIAVSILIVLALSLSLLFRINAKRPDPVQRAYLAYCAAMAKRGATRKPSEGPRDFAARVSMQLPEVRETAHKISELYVSLRYGKEGGCGELQELRDAVRTLR